MTIENFEAPSDPTAGENAGEGNESQGTQPAAPAAPAERTYTKSEYDREFANARRSWEYQTNQRLERERAQWQSQQRQPQASPEDPWSALDPTVASAFRKIFAAELAKGIEPFKAAQEAQRQQQEDLAFKGEEADLRAKYPDYGPNRNQVLEYAVANGIQNAEAAFHSWRSATQWDKNASQAVAAHLAKKQSQATRTPSVERGGGAPSGKTSFRNKDGSLDKDAMDAHALELLTSRE